MKNVQRQTRSWLMELFTQHGFNPRGDLGQNFLIDVNLIEFAVRHASLGPNDVALEVGSGTGGMTAFLFAWIVLLVISTGACALVARFMGEQIAAR